MEEKSDSELVALARADDKHAFNQLIERYQLMALCLALRYVAREDVAHDLVQEALLQAYLSLEHLHDAAHFKSWFYGIVLNMCRSWLRANSRTTLFSLEAIQQEDQLFNDVCVAGLDVDPQVVLEEQEMRRSMREAVNMLPVGTGEVVRLFYYEDKSVQQIATMLEISLTAVRNRLLKGRQQMRIYLQGVYPEMTYASKRTYRRNIMITMKIARVQRQEKMHRTVLVLIDEQQKRGLPLWFSNLQDYAHQLRMRRISGQSGGISEPLTTDFIINMLNALGGSIEGVGIDVLQEDILFAKVFLRDAHGQHTVKAQLDDALPLALRANCPFSVAKELLDARGVQLSEQGKMLEEQLDALIVMVNATYLLTPSQSPITTQMPRNLDFADGLRGWTFIGHPNEADIYNYRLEPEIMYNGKPALMITLKESEQTSKDGFGEGFALLMHEGFLANQYRGQRLRMTAFARAEDVKYAAFGLNVNGPVEPDSPRRVKYMAENLLKPIEGTSNWTRYEVVIDVPQNATSVQVNFNMRGKGNVWLAGIQFDVVDASVPTTDTKVFPVPEQPQNLDFRQGFAHWQVAGSFPQDYERSLETNEDQPILSVRNARPEPRGSIVLEQTISTYNYQRKRIRLSGEIRTKNVEQQAAFFLNIGFGGNERLERVVQGSSVWQYYSIEMQVSEKVTNTSFGVTLYGKGQVSMRNVHLEVVEG